MIDAQMSLTGGFDKHVQDRKDQIQQLRDRARMLAKRWQSVHEGYTTPVPIDIAHHHTWVALQHIQYDRADDHLVLAAERLNEAEWHLEKLAGADGTCRTEQSNR